MQISHSHRFIFVHIFKTAGTSMRAALEPYTQPPGVRLWRGVRRCLGFPAPEPFPQLSGHSRACDVRNSVTAEVFQNYFKFAFVRNPWDWQVSWYHFIVQNRTHHEHEAVTSLGSFADFLRWRIDHPVWHQKDFIADEGGIEIVDFVGKFENLEADFAHVCAVAGVGAQLPHLNRSRHADYRRYYCDRSCLLLEQYSKADIEYFGYSFDPAREATPVILPARVAPANPIAVRRAA
jgi:hypothetical protein